MERGDDDLCWIYKIPLMGWTFLYIEIRPKIDWMVA